MSKKKKNQVVEQAAEVVESIESIGSTEEAAAEEETDWKDKYLIEAPCGRTS